MRKQRIIKPGMTIFRKGQIYLNDPGMLEAKQLESMPGLILIQGIAGRIMPASAS